MTILNFIHIVVKSTTKPPPYPVTRSTNQGSGSSSILRESPSSDALFPEHVSKPHEYSRPVFFLAKINLKL